MASGAGAGDDLDARVGTAEAVREVFELMPLQLIGMTGPQHQVDAVNYAYRAEWSRHDMIGRSVRDLFPEVVGQQIFQSMDRVLATGVPQVARGWRVEIDNGSGNEAEMHYADVTFAPRRDASGAVVGVLMFGVDSTDQELERRRVEQEAAVAVQRYERALDVITSLQRHLLPAGLPVLPSLLIGASYLLADADDAAGGDWFDAVPVPGGQVALVVGDVVGHGVAASATMGQLRTVLQDRLDETGDVLGAVAAADRLARRVPDARAATVCVALLDPADGTLTWCSAGHPPPLIAGADHARFLPASGQGPLGTGAAYTLLHDRLELRELMLLYSDGIIERPGRTPAAATAELAEVTSHVIGGRGFRDPSMVSSVDRACTQTLELLVRQTGHTDDITLLAAQRRIPVPPLQLGGLTSLSAIRVTRSAVDAWADDLKAGEEDRVALDHAVVELVTNAIEHARPDSAGLAVTVNAELSGDSVAQLTVADNGRWRERARPGDDAFRQGHGFGLAMTASLADRLDVDRHDDGTTVTVRRRLSRPGRLLTANQISHGGARPAEEWPELMMVLDQPSAPGSRIAVHGPLDASNVEELGTELDRYTLGGTHEVVVDLTGVTHLASAAVAELYRTKPDRAQQQFPLRLYAPAGSIAHHVLSLVDLPHTTTDPHLEDSDAPASS